MRNPATGIVFRGDGFDIVCFSPPPDDLDDDCDKAIAQIYQKGYDKVRLEGYEHQLIYGIAFFGKKARVKLAK